MPLIWQPACTPLARKAVERAMRGNGEDRASLVPLGGPPRAERPEPVPASRVQLAVVLGLRVKRGRLLVSVLDVAEPELRLRAFEIVLRRAETGAVLLHYHSQPHCSLTPGKSWRVEPDEAFARALARLPRRGLLSRLFRWLGPVLSGRNPREGSAASAGILTATAEFSRGTGRFVIHNEYLVTWGLWNLRLVRRFV